MPGDNSPTKEANFGSYGVRPATGVSPGTLVKAAPLFQDRNLPLLIEPAVEGLSLPAWAEPNRALLNDQLLRHGGLLFRGFDLQKPSDMEEVIQAILGKLPEFREASMLRESVAGRIYAGTAYPPDSPIFVRNESSYANQWPLKIFLFCLEPPIAGGETYIADIRRVLRHIKPEIRERFTRKGWMYIRNFENDFGLSWQMAFQTSDRAEVEAHCAKNDIKVEWREGNRLRTHAVRSVFARHPKTGESLWFNHVTFFNISTLEPVVREALMSTLNESELPTNTYYGDGLPIEPEVMEHLREAYRRETVSVSWKKGDLLLLDNMLVAYGRASFTGSRKVLVGMVETVTREEATTQPVSSEISMLYLEIRDLIAQSSHEAEVRREIDQKLQRLRTLQEAEAEELERHFEERLRLKSGAGWAHLQRIKERLGDA